VFSATLVVGQRLGHGEAGGHGAGCLEELRRLPFSVVIVPPWLSPRGKFAAVARLALRALFTSPRRLLRILVVRGDQVTVLSVIGSSGTCAGTCWWRAHRATRVLALVGVVLRDGVAHLVEVFAQHRSFERRGCRNSAAPRSSAGTATIAMTTKSSISVKPFFTTILVGPAVDSLALRSVKSRHVLAFARLVGRARVGALAQVSPGGCSDRRRRGRGGCAAGKYILSRFGLFWSSTPARGLQALRKPGLADALHDAAFVGGCL